MKRTPQYLFDRVVRQMISQGGPSVDANGYCAYRGWDGRKCAVGAILPDEAYFSDMEDVRVATLADMQPPIEQAAAYKVWVDEVLTPNLEFLTALQSAHDDSGDLPGILDRMRSVGRHYALRIAATYEVAHA
jgi:hypothetical protein